MKKPSITQQIKTLLFTSAPQWWSPLEVEHSLVARSAPRRMREIMEADKAWTGRGEAPGHLRQYESKWVDNILAGRHKVYRWKGITTVPDLFD